MAKLFESEAEAVDQLLLWNTMCSARAMIAVGGGGGGEFEWEKERGKELESGREGERGAIEGRRDSADAVN